jgi:hypothetical protein
MVQIFETGNPQGKIAEMLGMSLGQGLGNGLNTYYANKALNDVLEDNSMKDAPISAKMGKLQSALSPYGEKGQEIFQQRMSIEQQGQQEKEKEKQQQEQEVLGRAVAGEEVSAKDLKKVSPQNQLKLLEFQKKKQAGKGVYDALIKAKYPEETAKLWQSQMENAPVGGQTNVITQVNDLLKRSKSGKGLAEGEEEKQMSKPTIEIPGIDMDAFELDFPELPEPIGMTPADTVKQNEHREKVNIPVYTETVDRLNALDDEYREVKHLQDLNEIPDALPTGVQKWNVNWDTGDLRVKALATPEAQDYVKTIARMARRAKDFFPGRVTNFDLDQFKAGFPTLANSPEGRTLIAEQLSLGNRIAYLKDETLKAAYDHYGSGADPVLVKRYATENYRRLKGTLEDKLKETNKLASAIVQAAGPESSESQEKPSLEDIFK